MDNRKMMVVERKIKMEEVNFLFLNKGGKNYLCR